MDFIKKFDKYFLYSYIDEIGKSVCVIKRDTPQQIKDIVYKKYDIVEFE